MRSLTLINGWGGLQNFGSWSRGLRYFYELIKAGLRNFVQVISEKYPPPTEILNDQSLTKWIIVILWFEHFLFFYDYAYANTIFSLSLYPLLHHRPTITYCMYTNRATIMKNNHRCSLTTSGHIDMSAVLHLDRISQNRFQLEWQNLSRWRTFL